jgi:hypothetical protein
MRLLLGLGFLSSLTLAFVGCSASESGREGSVGESGEGGERDGHGGSSSKGARGGRGGGSSTAGASDGGDGSKAGTGSSAGSGAVAGSGGTGAAAGQGSGAAEAGGAAGAMESNLGGADDVPGAAGQATSPPLQGSCTAPCELELGPTDNLPGDSAVVLYDFATNTATVTSDPAANAASGWVIGFSYEEDPQRGYGAWSTGSWWFAFTEPLEYVEGTNSMQQNVEVTSQLVNPTTDQILRVVYSFGDHSVRVHAIGVPDCDAAPSGACASPGDCALVEAGTLRMATEACAISCGSEGEPCIARCIADDEELSLECSACYGAFLTCVDTGCPLDCPGEGGSYCMACETAADCHTAFMACSGLDYMPRGTLTWPLAQPAR